MQMYTKVVLLNKDPLFQQHSRDLNHTVSPTLHKNLQTVLIIIEQASMQQIFFNALTRTPLRGKWFSYPDNYPLLYKQGGSILIYHVLKERKGIHDLIFFKNSVQIVMMYL